MLFIPLERSPQHQLHKMLFFGLLLIPCTYAKVGLSLSNTKAASSFTNCGCQCSSLMFRDSKGTLQGNCNTVDSSGRYCKTIFCLFYSNRLNYYDLKVPSGAMQTLIVVPVKTQCRLKDFHTTPGPMRHVLHLFLVVTSVLRMDIERKQTLLWMFLQYLKRYQRSCQVSQWGSHLFQRFSLEQVWIQKRMLSLILTALVMLGLLSMPTEVNLTKYTIAKYESTFQERQIKVLLQQNRNKKKRLTVSTDKYR